MTKPFIDNRPRLLRGYFVNASDVLVPNAMRLAEYAHRQRNHRRKAPPGEDRPAYFLHLAEVAWLLMDSGVCDAESVAAAYLHDIIEDCGYDEATLAGRLSAMCGWRRWSPPCRKPTKARVGKTASTTTANDW